MPGTTTATSWPKHLVRVGNHRAGLQETPEPEKQREHIEPWLSALFQAEHLNLLVGSGLTIAVAKAANSPTVEMRPVEFHIEHARAVHEAARASPNELVEANRTWKTKSGQFLI